MIPIVTVLGLEFGSLVAFSVVTETIFAWPGMASSCWKPSSASIAPSSSPT